MINEKLQPGERIMIERDGDTIYWDSHREKLKEMYQGDYAIKE